MKNNLIKFQNCFLSHASVTVGKKESEGPLHAFFDLIEPDEYFGCGDFESAESEMVRRNINLLLKKAKIDFCDLDVALGGDLLNQCVATSFALKDSGVPFLGLYGACTTVAESILLGSILVDRQVTENALCMASSHFCSAERQYRFPLEYGSVRTPTSQSTVTGTGAFLLTNKSSEICVLEAMAGRIVDKEVTDANNMGAAMAGAAVDTILRYFDISSFSPSDFDIIATGDLGHEGHDIAKELLKKSGFPLNSNFIDCGMLIYDKRKQDTHSGGSGCGCLASVLGSYFFKSMINGNIKRILAIGTGALLNPNTVFQKKTIPSIAHCVHICRSDI